MAALVPPLTRLARSRRPSLAVDLCFRMPHSTLHVRSLSTPGSGRKKVLLMDPIQLATEVQASLGEKYELVSLDSRTRQEFIRDCASEKYRGIEAIYRHFKGSSNQVTGRFDSTLVQALPASLKFICHNGAGYDQIDVDSCTTRRIQVSNVPVAVDDATADTALFLLLGSIRQFGLAQKSLYSGHFNSRLPLANDPKGKLLGIVGMGGIGRAFAQRAQSLGMKVQYHNRKRLQDSELERGAEYVDTLEELLKSSDVVSLNLPLNEKTKGLIGKTQLEMMKPTAILINTARGGVVNEKELVEALETGEIAGCGLDVYEDEPRVSQGLLNSDKAFLLPHVGTLTVETQTEMEAVCLRNIDQGLETGNLGFTVPEQRGSF